MSVTAFAVTPNPNKTVKMERQKKTQAHGNVSFLLPGEQIAQSLLFGIRTDSALAGGMFPGGALTDPLNQDGGNTYDGRRMKEEE